MIRELRISNLALIDDLVLEFGPGLSVLTGETGAGKSILMDALALVAGERADAEHIRSGSDEAEVSAVFEVPAGYRGLLTLLHEQEISCPGDQIIVRRRMQRNGRNRILVNERPVTLALLKQIGDLLVDLHGQNDHQSLLNPATAREIVDRLPDVAPAAAAHAQAYAAFAAAATALRDHDERAARLAERKDILEFQQRELSALAATPGEEAELEKELALVSSSTERAEHASEMARLLRGGDTSAESILASVRKHLQTLARLDPTVTPWTRDLESAQTTLSELGTFCESYLEKAQEHADPRRVEAINERLAHMQRLAKKYRCTTDQLADKLAQVNADLASLADSAADRQVLERTAEETRRACETTATALHQARAEALRVFDHQVSREMTALGFTGGAWVTVLKPLDTVGPYGRDEVTFTVRTNPGEPFLPLAAIASGGEIARLMLAIKTVLAGLDTIPVLVFDEVDAGIGGTVAHEVGRRLHELSRDHQVLCVSHLHQIASQADHHYQVSKTTVEKRTVTRVRRLHDNERIAEIARMLGGDSEAALRHAEELLKRGQR